VPLEINFAVWGDEQVSRVMRGVSDRARTIIPLAAEELRQHFFEMEERQFESQGRTGSGGWVALKASTIAAKVSKGQDPRILHATHRLRESLTQYTADTVIDVSEHSIFLGTSVPYAEVHQKGGQDYVAGLAPKEARRLRKVARNQRQAGLIGKGEFTARFADIRGRSQHQGLPRRPPVELSEKDRREFIKIIQARLKGAPGGGRVE
jgi:phage gpG-like protein